MVKSQPEGMVPEGARFLTYTFRVLVGLSEQWGAGAGLLCSFTEPHKLEIVAARPRKVMTHAR